MSREIAPFGVRMPPELKDWLAQQAKQNNRSLNSEIVHRLEQMKDEQSVHTKLDKIIHHITAYFEENS